MSAMAGDLSGSRFLGFVIFLQMDLDLFECRIVLTCIKLSKKPLISTDVRQVGISFYIWE